MAEDRARVELMIDFYEHRLAHGSFIKNNGTSMGGGGGGTAAVGGKGIPNR